MMTIETLSVAETQSVGQTIGRLINQPTAIALIGDLGSGKTAFVQGLARGLEVPSSYYVTSPTFTLINEYPGRLPLFHIDLYRLETVGDLEDIGLDDIICEPAVLAIEWADRLVEKFFIEYLSLHFKIIDDDFRRLELIACGQEGINLIKTLESHLKTE